MSDNFMDLLSDEDPEENKPGEKGMGDLLGGLLGGLTGGGAAPQTGGGGGDISDLLGGLMGGGVTPQTGGGGGDISDLLGGLMGGGASGGAGSSGGLGGLLGGLLGGGGGAGQMSFGGGGGGVSLPFAGTLAKKLGISEQMANMLIMGAIGLLTSSAAKNRSATRGGEVDINSLTDPDFIRSSGVSGRLADQMGISEDDAILGLQQTIGLIAAGNQPAPKTKKSTARKTTAKTGASTGSATTKKAAAPKKTAAKSTKTTPKKKTTKKESGSDFMDLLDDLTQ